MNCHIMQTAMSAVAAGVTVISSTGTAHAAPPYTVPTEGDADKQEEVYVRSTSELTCAEDESCQAVSDLKIIAGFDGFNLYFKGQYKHSSEKPDELNLKALKVYWDADDKTQITLGHIFGDEAFGNGNQFDKYRTLLPNLYATEKSITGAGIKHVRGPFTLEAVAGVRDEELSRSFLSDGDSGKKKNDIFGAVYGGRLDYRFNAKTHAGVNVVRDEGIEATQVFGYVEHGPAYGEALLQNGELEQGIFAYQFKNVTNAGLTLVPAIGYERGDGAFGSVEALQPFKIDGREYNIGLGATTQNGGTVTAALTVSF